MSERHDLPEDFVLEWMRKYEDKIQALEELNANEIIAERKRNVAVFSDAQTDRFDAILARAITALLNSDAFAARTTKIVQDIAGAQALRFFVYLCGAFIAGALSVIFFKGH